MLANNELGTLQPVAEAADACRERGVPLLCDAVQAVGKHAVDVASLGADYVVVAAHKFNGPVGAAALWVREGAGDRFADLEIEIGAYFPTVTDATQPTLEAMADAFGMPPEELARHPHALIGSVSEICETLQHRRDAYGISYVTVRGANMADFAPVVAALSGT